MRPRLVWGWWMPSNMSSSSLEFNGTTPCWRLLPFFLWASPPLVFSLSGPEGRMTAGMFMWDAHSIIPQNIFVASSFLLEHASSEAVIVIDSSSFFPSSFGASAPWPLV